jgi:hypothetical protein
MTAPPETKLHSKPVPASEGRQALNLNLPSKGPISAPGPQGDPGLRSEASNEMRQGGGGSAPQARPALPAAVPVSSSRLDTGTICDPGEEKAPDRGYRLVLRDYGKGLVEASVTIKTPTKKKRPALPAEKTDAEKDTENRERAVRRARTVVRQTIMAAQLDHLVTLTYRENQTCPKLAWEHFALFTRLLRKHRRGKPYAFIAVLERQKRGAMHVHMAVHGYQDVRLLRALWQQAIGKLSGNIDVAHRNQELARMARYLCKYITKEIEAIHEQGDHRYKRSRNIVVPKIVSVLPFHIAVDAKLLELFDEHGAAITYHRNELTRDGPKWLWACSW